MAFGRGSRIGVFVLVVLLFGIVGVSSGQAAKAPRWKVAGAFLESGKTESAEGSSVGTIQLEGAGLVLTSTSCTIVEGVIEGSAAGAPGKKRKHRLKCTGTTIPGFPSVCISKTAGQAAGTIASTLISAFIVYLAKHLTLEVGQVLKAESGTELFKIEVSGAECPFTGVYPVTGELVGKYLTSGETEVEETELEFPATPITSYFENAETNTATTISELKVKGGPGKLKGKTKTRLSPKKKFGVFPG